MKFHITFVQIQNPVQLNPEIRSKAAQIKAIFFDVDGVLTDGGIIYDNHGLEFKRFNVKDGLIIKYLKRFGIITGVITGRDSQVVRNRCEEIGIDIHYHGVVNKLKIFEEVLSKQNLHVSEVAYIGDDLNDIPILVKCGLAATPLDGHYTLKKYVHLILEKKGGEGAVRELADIVLIAKGIYNKILDDLTP